METAVPEYVKDMADFRNTAVKRTIVPTMSPQTDVSLQDVPTGDICPHVIPAEELTPQCECGKPREGRYKKCAACRKRAYRERSRG